MIYLYVEMCDYKTKDILRQAVNYVYGMIQ